MPPAPADAAGTPTPADAGTTPATVDAGGGVRAVVRLAPTTLLTGADLTAAEVLAADADGVYWVTSANELWMLSTGSETPRRLAVDPNLSDGISNGTCLAARGKYLFWSAYVKAPAPNYFNAPLHRTDKMGGDVVLFPSFWCAGSQPASDDGHLYYVASGAETAYVAALPLDADPGTAPTLLAPIDSGMSVYAMAADNQYVYWNEWPLAEMVPVDTGPVFRGETAALLAGEQTHEGEYLADAVSQLLPSGGRLYIIYETLTTARVGRVDEQGVEADLPLPVGSFAVVGDWVVTSTGRLGYPSGKSYAASTAAVAGDGSVAVEIADDVAFPPVAGAPGLVFVDSGGHLLAVSAPDIGAAVAAGQP